MRRSRDLMSSKSKYSFAKTTDDEHLPSLPRFIPPHEYLPVATAPALLASQKPTRIDSHVLSIPCPFRTGSCQLRVRNHHPRCPWQEVRTGMANEDVEALSFVTELLLARGFAQRPVLSLFFDPFDPCGRSCGTFDGRIVSRMVFSTGLRWERQLDYGQIADQ